MSEGEVNNLEGQLKFFKFKEFKDRYVKAYEVSNNERLFSIYYKKGRVYIQQHPTGEQFKHKIDLFEGMTIELERRCEILKQA